MSLRTVFGRRRVEYEGRQFVIEMRTDGIYVRQKHCRLEWHLPFATLLNHAKLQPEFFYSGQVVPRDPQPQVPDLQPGQLVCDDSGPVGGPVHEGGEPPAQSAQVGGDGLAAPAGLGLPTAVIAATLGSCPASADNQLPGTDSAVDPGDAGPVAERVCSELESQPAEPAPAAGVLRQGAQGVGIPDEGRL